MNSGTASLRRAAVLLVIAAVSVSVGQRQTGAKAPMATSERSDLPGWWPTKGTLAMSEYVGPAACTCCHLEIAASQQKTPMFQAAHLARDSRIPLSGHDLKFSDEVYSYVVSRTPDGVTFFSQESDGIDLCRCRLGLWSQRLVSDLSSQAG